jgi:hypothetical protein
MTPRRYNPGMPATDLDADLRHRVYAALARGERAPLAADLSAAVGSPLPEVRAALERLHAAHALVLDEATREVRMALPFSAVATAYRVEADGRRWDVNCAWDAIAAVRLLGLRDARLHDAGGPGRDARVLAVSGGLLSDADGVLSFPRPAWRWWDDIVFT